MSETSVDHGTVTEPVPCRQCERPTRVQGGWCRNRRCQDARAANPEYRTYLAERMDREDRRSKDNRLAWGRAKARHAKALATLAAARRKDAWYEAVAQVEATGGELQRLLQEQGADDRRRRVGDPHVVSLDAPIWQGDQRTRHESMTKATTRRTDIEWLDPTGDAAIYRMDIEDVPRGVKPRLKHTNNLLPPVSGGDLGMNPIERSPGRMRGRGKRTRLQSKLVMGRKRRPTRKPKADR